MTNYVIASLVSFILLTMGAASFVMGLTIYRENTGSKSGLFMFKACISVFVWDFGYGWMGMCYDTDFAYIPRAIALYAVLIFLYYLIKFLAKVSHTEDKYINLPLAICIVGYTLAWPFIITKKVATFTRTPWGYWYTSAMNWARILQFAVVIFAIVFFYVILYEWKKRSKLKREHHLIRRFMWFGPIMFAGYSLDTLMPMIAHTPAIPGSAVAAFAAAMLLCTIAKKTRLFGISINNVAEYVFKEVTTPVLVLDYSGHIVLYNAFASQVFDNFKTEEGTLKGLMLSDIIEEIEDSERRLPNFINKVKNSDIYCRPNGSVVYDEFDEELCTLVFVTDITDTYHAMLESEENKRIAEQASEAKSNFLANMSHEIRTPMNAIIGMSDIILRDQELSDELRSQVENIKDAGDGLLGIINDILDISKIESGKYELIDVDYDLPSIIHDVSTIIHVKLSETPVELKININEDTPTDMYGDELRIRQILLNLMGNAVKFTQRGFIELDCYSELDEDAQHCSLHFDIRDSGIGIKPEDINSIFGSFNQVDTRKNRNIQGTGLGLTISRNLARMMGGDITVSSKYGEGSTFHVTIRQKVVNYRPIGEDVVNSLRNMKYHVTKAESVSEIVKRTDKKILIVDDAKVNLIVAKGLFKPYGMSIDTATCGADAIDLVRSNDYDAVFMDHMMPELDGVDTTKIIRKMEGEKYKNLIIIALTANAVAGTKEMLIAEGMNDFLAKPIDKVELNKVIEKWL